MPDNSQLSSSRSVAQVTEMTDAHEPFWQNMHQESSDELLSFQPLGL
jgi:hypothetical protein